MKHAIILTVFWYKEFQEVRISKVEKRQRQWCWMDLEKVITNVTLVVRLLVGSYNHKIGRIGKFSGVRINV